ncbi:MotA/TolQ/ExbB proton channel family protein [Motilimonas pumila]|uniref:MotA/TolQ/ExbB proton channel family protein n=1 Tax=Motilimonas pumila TaxID=2303987 RepID=A0A418YED1_9GAMM|nr:MotA/TolQ/ExbB proton channel family protein [Motilimonas pumila]RJG47503.1 MotA/TolQ/ExbB proton channel family protein [Motilimonas pumila]
MNARTFLFGLCFSLLLPAQTLHARSVAEVAQSISVADQTENKARLAQFKADRDQQQSLFEQSAARLASAQQRQAELQLSFDENETRLAELQAELKQRTAQLGEVFGVVKQQANETQGMLLDSLVSAQYPGRADQLAFANQKRIPTVEEFKALWATMHHELSESGKVVSFQAPVVNVQGQVSTVDLVRVGNFQVLTHDGEYVRWQPSLAQLAVFEKQPDPFTVNQARQFIQGQESSLTIDPTRGQLLQLLGQMPSLKDRIHQGSYVGYFILFLGAIGLVIAVWRLLALFKTEFGVRAQLRQADALKQNNPLGRVLSKASQSDLNVEDLELRVDEAILQELPKLERGQSLIKLFAAVAPLLGLLGTVTGMIGTFQSITLFGTSDPKLMAGGISQALVTTVLGLIVAIPLLFSHNLLNTRSRRIIQILQQKSLALLADRRESQATGKQ